MFATVFSRERLARGDPEFNHCCPGPRVSGGTKRCKQALLQQHIVNVFRCSNLHKVESAILEQNNGPHLPPARLVELDPQNQKVGIAN